MAEPATPSRWLPRRAWEGVLAGGHFGKADETGVMVQTREALGIATLIAGEDGHAALGAAMHERFGLTLPQAPIAVRSGGRQLVWTGPGQWLLIADSRKGFRDDLAKLAGLAAIADQSNGRAVLSLSGPHVRDLLAKGVMLDLHPAAFLVGTAASTSIAYLGVTLWRSIDGPEGPVFEIMAARSMAGSFWSWLSASAGEFGYAVTTGRASSADRG
uniref:Sarcosine oxidase subunit gamma n=1 Tax=Bosea sp. NBC_00436 TaxID=2969620 RepID=A0A9E7ZHV3_9HYPH